MDDGRPRFQFHLSHLLGITLAVAMLLGAYRLHSGLFLLLAWLAYAAILIFIASLLKWSDIAVSICFLLIVLPLFIALFIPAEFAS